MTHPPAWSAFGVIAGPWELFLNAKVPQIRAHNKRMIARVWGHVGDAPIGEYYSQEDLQNARLIASAPDLLRVLKAAQGKLCEHCPPVSPGEPGKHTNECLDALELIYKVEENFE